MIPVVLLLIGAMLLVSTAVLASASLRPSSFTTFVLAAYVLAWAEVVVLTEALSPARGVGSLGYLVGEAVLLIVAWAVWRRRGRPVTRVPRLSFATVRGHPVVAALGVVVGLAVVYEAAIGLSTPSTDIDELWYHLPRAAAWLHHGGLYRIPGGNAAENDYPPNAEIGVLYGFAFLHRDTVATVPQLVAQLSLVTIVYGLARRIGSSVAAGLFAGLLVLTLSEVALEAMTALNDIVVASFVGAAAYFTLGRRDRAELALAGLAIGLALGTKYTAFFALPWLLLLAAGTLPRRRVVALLACSVLGFAVFGSYGYGENLYWSHTLLGRGAQGFGGAPAAVTAPGTVSTMARNTYRFLDLSGYRVKTRWLEPIASVGKDVFRVLHIPTAPPESSTGGSPFTYEVNVGSSPGGSWYGPLGPLLVIPLSIVFCVRWALGRSPRIPGILALCLPLYLLMSALSYRYTSQGRFFITPIVLTLPLAAVVYAPRRLAGAIAIVAGVTLLFAVAYDAEKPTGLAGTTPIWQLDRSDAQSLTFGHGVGKLIRAVNRLPSTEDIGFDAAQLYFGYALYGPRMRRGLVPLGTRNLIAEAERRRLRAIYVAPYIAARSAARGWITERFPGAGTLLLRAERGPARLHLATHAERGAAQSGRER